MTPTLLALALTAPAARAQTNAECYNPVNAGTVGHWTGCAGMYIVRDLDDLIDGCDAGYKFAIGGVDYTFGDSANNIFTGQVTDMHELFFEITTFNEDIGYWDTSNVTDMEAMFWLATAFNQPIGSWDMSSVSKMDYMFEEASSFDQNINGWDVTLIGSPPPFFDAGTSAGWTAAEKPVWGSAGAPRITGVSSSTPDGTYGAGAVISIRVNFTRLSRSPARRSSRWKPA